MANTIDLLLGVWREDPSKKRNKSPEATVGKQVDSFFESIGAYVRTIKSDGTMDKKIRGGKGGWRKSAQGSGISDRVGILRFGRFVAVELKAPGKKKSLTLSQFRYLQKIIDRNGVGCVADSVADVKLALKQSKAEMMTTLMQWEPKEKVRDASSLEPLFP